MPAATKKPAKAPAAKKPAASATKAPAKAPARKTARPATTEAPARRAAAHARIEVGPEQRRNYVEVAAYFIAERHGFMPGRELQDWAAAEAEIDRLLAEGRLHP
jgi:hypothetical protein